MKEKRDGRRKVCQRHIVLKLKIRFEKNNNRRWWCLFKKDYKKGITKSNPTQKCRPAKGISKRVNINIIKDT
jgi:hypothetical protein